MKIQIKITLLVFLLSTLVWACNDLLEERPKSEIPIEEFFATDNDAIAAVNGIYAVLNATSDAPTFGGVYHSSYWVLQGLASDNMTNELAGALSEERLENFAHTPVNSILNDLWLNMYRGISYANFAIEGIPYADMDEVLRQRLIGEARFLRGILYFDLVRLFGDVPLVTPANQADLQPTKAKGADIYKFLIEDIEFASTVLPEQYEKGNGLGRATKGAAFAMLGRINLTVENYPEALTNLKAVIDLGIYDLWEDFAMAFNLTNENGKESVFGIGFGDGGGSISFWEVGQFNVRLLPKELSGEVQGINAQGWQIATQDLYNQYDPLDHRRDITFITRINNTDGSTTNIDPHFAKYWDRINEPNGGNTEQDFPHIRYSDVLLMYAEALNEVNTGPTSEAYASINRVRKRARFDGNADQAVLPDLTGLNYDEFKDAVLLERRKELAVEGHRWFDLKRFSKLSEKVPLAKPNVVVEERHNLFPIPQREIDINPNLLPQNSGY